MCNCNLNASNLRLKSLITILNRQRKTIGKKSGNDMGNELGGKILNRLFFTHLFVYASELDSPHEICPGDYPLQLLVLHDHQATQIMRGH